jgi:hypothetical protein
MVVSATGIEKDTIPRLPDREMGNHGLIDIEYAAMHQLAAHLARVVQLKRRGSCYAVSLFLLVFFKNRGGLL